jgi:uncharacterized protein
MRPMGRGRSAMTALLLTAGVMGSGAAAADAPIADAAMDGDVETIRTLLRRAVDVNATQTDGMTGLHWAAHHDDVALADLLLDAGADLNATNRTGASPLYLAAINASTAMIERLLDAGADANAVLTGEGETVLMLASYTGNPDAVRLLLQRGADANARQFREQTALMWAAVEGHAEVIEVLLEHGADPRASSVPSTRPERRPAGGMTALLFASRQGHLDAVRALLEGGAPIDQTGADNTSALLIAVVNGHYEVADLLLENGADPGIADASGRAPLYAAIDLRNVQWSQAPAPELPQAHHMGMIRKLVAAGADLEARITGKIKHRGSFDMRWTELTGGTPFLRAAWNGDIEVMNFLLEQGADPEAVTEKNETALLLLAGAGWPLGQGYIRSDAEIEASLDLLVEHFGMDVNAVTTEGVTPLMAAAFKGTNNVVQYLADHGADLDAADEEGRTALVWSRGVAPNLGQPPRRQPETEKLLLELLERRGAVAMSSAGPAD